MAKQIKSCVILFFALSILTGLIYPMIITGLGQAIFPSQANGSLLRKTGRIVGSKLIGQQFENPRYFWGRLSATTPPYNASASSGSNLGPINPKLREMIKVRLEKLRAEDPENTQSIPIDLITVSGSGLDPHMSVAAAEYQKERVARLRQKSEQDVEALIQRYTTPRFLGLLGEPVVNVLELNLALDEMQS